MYDIGFMYTRRCDLSCAFCMYESGPDVHDAIDLGLLASWLETVPRDRVNSFGVYGGEVGVDLAGFGACFDLVVDWEKPQFAITNGTWSMSVDRTLEFLEFCQEYNCFVVISGTPWHRRHQDRNILEILAQELPDSIRLKPKEENFHAMGRLEGKFKQPCTRKCMWWNKEIRIAVTPDSTILMQNCDGSYPVVGSIDEPFVIIDRRITEMRKTGFTPVCDLYEKSLEQEINTCSAFVSVR